MIKMEKS